MCFCFLRICAGMVSEVDRILYLRLAKISPIISYSNPSVTPAVRHQPPYHTRTATCCSFLWGPSLLQVIPPSDSSGLVSVPTWCRHRAADSRSTCRHKPLSVFGRTLTLCPVKVNTARSFMWMIHDDVLTSVCFLENLYFIHKPPSLWWQTAPMCIKQTFKLNFFLHDSYLVDKHPLQKIPSFVVPPHNHVDYSESTTFSLKGWEINFWIHCEELI